MTKAHVMEARPQDPPLYQLLLDIGLQLQRIAGRSVKADERPAVITRTAGIAIDLQLLRQEIITLLQPATLLRQVSRHIFFDHLVDRGNGRRQRKGFPPKRGKKEYFFLKKLHDIPAT